jgi:ABC-2 type transport system permease protein
MPFLKKYRTFFSLGWQGLMTYRFDTTVYALTSLVTPMLGLFVWLAVQNGNPSLIYNRSEIIFYFLAAAVCGSITTAWSAYFINDSIKKGDIYKHLVKPYSVLELSLMNNLVEKVFKLMIIGSTLVVVAIIFAINGSLSLPLQYEYLPFCILSLFLSLLMMNFIDVSMGYAGFWMDDVDFLTGAFFTAEALLSGKIIPFTFLPNLLQQIGFFLPFRYTVSFPIEIMMGKLNYLEIISGFIVLVFWTISFWFLQKYLFKTGTIRYGSYGG